MSTTEKSLMSKATIFDVAELAGVSIKTVSRVMNREPNVRAGTRDKVLAAVHELDYQPNAAARGLSGGRSYAIGLVYENPREFSYFGDVLSGALTACEEEGYSLLLRPLGLLSAELVDEVRNFAIQARLDGVVLPAPICDMEEVRSVLREIGIPIAVIAPRTQLPENVNILCEDEQASFDLTQHVIRQGHQRIGFIKGHPDHGSSAKRFVGYRRALEENGIPYKASFVTQGYFDFESGKRAAGKLLDLESTPSVILASNDDMAAGVLFEARARGMTIPEDLSVGGFDDTPLASRMWPPLTTVRQPIREMADRAARLLIGRLRGKEDCEELVTFGCEIVIRDSTAGP